MERKIGLLRENVSIIPFGERSHSFLIHSISFSSLIFSSPKVSTWIDTGSFTPIAYDNCTSALLYRPLLTIVAAMFLAA